MSAEPGQVHTGDERHFLIGVACETSRPVSPIDRPTLLSCKHTHEARPRHISGSSGRSPCAGQVGHGSVQSSGQRLCATFQAMDRIAPWRSPSSFGSSIMPTESEGGHRTEHPIPPLAILGHPVDLSVRVGKPKVMLDGRREHLQDATLLVFVHSAHPPLRLRLGARRGDDERLLLVSGRSGGHERSSGRQHRMGEVEQRRE